MFGTTPGSTVAARPPGWALASAASAPVVLIGGWLASEALQPAGRYDPVRQTISVLAGHAATDRWLMATCLYLIAACHLITAAGLRGAPRPARLALAAGGLAGLGIATFAQPRHGATGTHLSFTVVGLLAMLAFACLLTDRNATRFPLRPRDALLAAAISVVLIGWVLQATRGTTLGLAERVLTAQETLWPLLTALALRRAPAVTPIAAAPTSAAPTPASCRTPEPVGRASGRGGPHRSGEPGAG